MISSGSALSEILVLCYHAVSERWPAVLAVAPTQFERQLDFLVSRGYRGSTFHEAIHAPPAPKTLAVTFDDAYRSVFTRARPLLDRFGLPATVFAPTKLIDTARPMSWPGIDHWLNGPHREELVPMSWDQLRALADSGWEIGSHTRTHPRLTLIGDDAIATELEGSRRDCEAALGRECRSLAYPFGDEDGRVVEAARAAGYSAAGALPPSLYPPAPLRWPRVGVYRVDDDSRFRLKVSPLVRRARQAGSGWRRVLAHHRRPR